MKKIPAPPNLGPKPWVTVLRHNLSRHKELHAALQPGSYFSKKQWPPMLSTKPSKSYLQPSGISIHSLAGKSQIPFEMSQIIPTVNSKANGVAFRDEKAEPIPDAESVAVLKAKHPVCTENLFSEASNPVEDVHHSQLVATNQPDGNCINNFEF